MTSPWTVDTPLGTLDVNGWTLVWAVLVLIGTVLAARYVAGATRRLGARVPNLADDVLLQIIQFVRYAIYALGAGVILSLLGAPIQPVLIAVLITLGALVLVGRGVADNFGAGLVIQVRHPLRPGDLIECDGHEGHVIDLNSREVLIQTYDGAHVHLPNNLVMNSSLLNLTASGSARSKLEVRIAVDGPAAADDLIRLVLDTALAVSGVLGEPPPTCPMTAATPTEVVLRLLLWHDPESALDVCSRVTAALGAALGDAGVQYAISWPPPAPAAFRLGTT
ncbi:mechanosensitive ion channel [Nocardioides sp. MAH-18]|uniref:Mechanosensitive ion channel n=1 Tax=Nocardioides agri TaxID=2682843 RepID=A0A6L6XX13_9ACTN|nr:mechanosensitive ion channel [Nocardioides sp. MAH-18]